MSRRRVGHYYRIEFYMHYTKRCEMKTALEKAVHKFSIIFQDQVDREVEYTETIGEAIQRFLKILPEDPL